ncbi:MAG: glycosyltransferase family 39 protein [Acidimicrobiia bacterium]
MTALDTGASAPTPADPHDAGAASRTADGRARRNARRRNDVDRWWPLLALIVLAIAGSLVIRRVIYPAFSWNRDEVTYLWQMTVLRSHHLFGSDGGFPTMFQPWLTGVNEHGFFSQYTLGWPLVLVAAELLGDPAIAILVGVVTLTVGAYAFAREVTRDHWLSILSTLLVLASPFFVVQSGVYLGYLFSTGVGLLFGAALLAGLRRDDWRLLVAAGALIGMEFLVRPYDAVLWGGAFAVYALIANWRRWRALGRGVVLAGAAFVPFLVLTLAYNRAITGSITQFPFTAKEPLDTFGFGVRRLLPGTRVTHFDAEEAVRGELRNALSFPQFLVGAWLGVVVAIVGLWMRRRQRSTWALLAVLTAFPVGYFVFWGIRLSSSYAFLSAPLYFIPAYVPCCILIATVIQALWRHRRVGAALLCAALLVVTLPFLYSRLHSNRAVSLAQGPWRNAGESITQSSLVFVAFAPHYLMHLNPFSRNTPELDGAVLYAADQPVNMLDVIRAHPERRPLLELTSNPELGDAFHHPYPGVPTVSLIPMSVLHGRQFTLHVRYTATTAGPIVARLHMGDVNTDRTLTDAATPGVTYETEWRVGDANVGAPRDGVIPLATTSGTFSVQIAAPAAAAVTRPFRVVHLEQQFAYQTVGDTTELLNPPRQYTVKYPKGKRLAVETPTLPGYTIDLVGTS